MSGDVIGAFNNKDNDDVSKLLEAIQFYELAAKQNYAPAVERVKEVKSFIELNSGIFV